MMRRALRLLLSCCFIALMAVCATPPDRPVYAHAGQQRDGSTDLPAVDPDYVYAQLFYMATHFLHREAGFDTNLPPTVNGHDEFAAYWSAEMLRDLQGFGPQVKRDPFSIRGWRNRPAVTPAFNVEVTVPGLMHPEQMVVIGCHYDSETISTQSANDDASGCAIELGVAKAMADYWRAHHLYPARTLRFVIFDAEEQGIYGSFHYLNSTVNGDLATIVAMFNEEQSGIGYPLRFLGQAGNPLLPTSIFVSPRHDNDAYPTQDRLSPQQQSAIAQFDRLMQLAPPGVFAQFRALGDGMVTYRNVIGQPVAQPIFTPDQLGSIPQQEDDVAASDEYPFTLAGLPAATFIGNYSYYPEYGGNNPPPWSYPFDQPEDTIQLMNTYANGTSQKAPTLALALALPGMLTTWMLSQPDVLGAAALDGLPIAAIGDVGQTRPGASSTFDAAASYDPAGGGPLSYTWTFGDGASGSGVTVSHVYAAAGTYTLRLTVSSPRGSRQIAKTIQVTASPPIISAPFTFQLLSGRPPANPAIVIPTPDDSLLGAVPVASSPARGQPGRSGGVNPIVGVPLALLALLIATLVLVLARRGAKLGGEAAPAIGVDEERRRKRLAALRALARQELDRRAPPSSRRPETRR